MEAGAGADHYGVEVVDFLGHGANTHWLVRRGRTEFVLRRFRPIRSVAYADYEVNLLDRLAALGHPVPTVVGAPVEVDGSVWFLMTRATGAPGSYDSDNPRERGRQLAKLHEGLAQLSGLGQREDREFTDVPVSSPTFDAALASYSDWFPEGARIMQWHLDRCRAQLAAHDTSTAPASTVHGDFTPWNLLFTNGALTGIVDFDLSHQDLRVAEFALSWRGKYDDVVFGFHEVSPLSDVEWELLTPVRWAWLLSFVESSIEEMQAGRSEPHHFEWVIQQLLRRSPVIERKVLPYRP